MPPVSFPGVMPTKRECLAVLMRLKELGDSNTLMRGVVSYTLLEEIERSP